jgi:hypothetical protein
MRKDIHLKKDLNLVLTTGPLQLSTMFHVQMAVILRFLQVKRSTNLITQEVKPTPIKALK